MEQELNQEKKTGRHLPEQMKKWLWKPGQSGNPKGRPKGKTLKEWVRDYLMKLNDEERANYLDNLDDPNLVWRMAEGNPHQTTDVTSGGKPIPILGGLSKDVPTNHSHKKDIATEEKA